MIGIPISNVLAGNTRIHGSLGNSWRNSGNKAKIYWLRNDVIFPKFKVFRIIGQVNSLRYSLFCKFSNSNYCSLFHFLINTSCPYIKSTPKDVRKTKNVIYLIGIIRPSCSHNNILSGFNRKLVGNLRVRISHCKNNWIFRHCFKHISSQYIRR